MISHGQDVKGRVYKGSLTGQVVSKQGDTDVDQVVQPARHDRFAIVRDDSDEFALEELVAVEENIIGEPGSSGCNHARAEVCKGEFEGLGIVTGNTLLLLGCGQLLASGSHLEGTEVDEPKGPHSWDSKGNAVCPLCRDLGIWWVAAAVVENQEENDQNDLIEELTPTLHEESTGDLSPSVKTIFLGRDLAASNSVLHTRCSRHGIFSADADTVEEERPDVADDPAIFGDTPGGSKHEETNEHDDSILNQTPSSTKPRWLVSYILSCPYSAYVPITKNSDQYLTDDDTANLQVFDSFDPGLVAYFVSLPARGESS